MRGYRKIIEQSVEFSEEELEMGEHMQEMDQNMRGIMGEMINHAERTGCREYEIIIRAKKKEHP